MHIRFLRDFQGRATNEQFYTAGTVIDHPNGATIVAEGAAEIYTVETRKGQVKRDEDGPGDSTPLRQPDLTDIGKVTEKAPEPARLRGRKP